MAIGVEFHGDWISFFAGSHLGVFFYPDRLTEKYQMHAQIKTIYIGIDCAIYIEHTMTNYQICNLNAEICLIYLNLSELTIKFRIFGDFQTTFWPITLRLPLWKGVIGLIRGSGKNCRRNTSFWNWCYTNDWGTTLSCLVWRFSLKTNFCCRKCQ